MPSTFKHPAHVPMWKGAKVAYFFIAMCLFPVAIGGFWAYGNQVSINFSLSPLRIGRKHEHQKITLARTFKLDKIVIKTL